MTYKIGTVVHLKSIRDSPYINDYYLKVSDYHDGGGAYICYVIKDKSTDGIDWTGEYHTFNITDRHYNVEVIKNKEKILAIAL